MCDSADKWRMKGCCVGEFGRRSCCQIGFVDSAFQVQLRAPGSTCPANKETSINRQHFFNRRQAYYGQPATPRPARNGISSPVNLRAFVSCLRGCDSTRSRGRASR
ncbi:hypothetical protein EYF80_033545 [Liparis tanakae]|uniref:Uncharacterized protein n=1 Tax=Liparis tanakae TaxID=230148 RepID=A0A4Z2GU60_9TELE|nr:hypothetical protein EYF80_033545 [Liparis tanakae]